MRLATRLVIVILAAGCVSRPPVTFSAPDRLDRWGRVAAIPPGAEVRVRCRGSTAAADGRFVRADDEALVLETDAGTTAVLRPRVTRVSVVSGKPWRRYLGNGLRTGLLFGGVVLGAFVAAGGLNEFPEGVAVVPGVGIFYGVAIGALSAAATPDTTVVFEAPAAGAPPAARGPGRLPPRPASDIEAPDAGEPPAVVSCLLAP